MRNFPAKRSRCRRLPYSTRDQRPEHYCSICLNNIRGGDDYQKLSECGALMYGCDRTRQLPISLSQNQYENERNDFINEGNGIREEKYYGKGNKKREYKKEKKPKITYYKKFACICINPILQKVTEFNLKFRKVSEINHFF